MDNYIAGIQLKQGGTQPGVKRGPYRKRTKKGQNRKNNEAQNSIVKDRFDDEDSQTSSKASSPDKSGIFDSDCKKRQKVE